MKKIVCFSHFIFFLQLVLRAWNWVLKDAYLESTSFSFITARMWTIRGIVDLHFFFLACLNFLIHKWLTSPKDSNYRAKYIKLPLSHFTPLVGNEKWSRFGSYMNGIDLSHLLWSEYFMKLYQFNKLFLQDDFI